MEVNGLANAPALITKYGVPKEAMPETFASSDSDTANLNLTLNLELSKAAMKIRQMKAAGKSDEELRAFKKETMSDVYQMTSQHETPYSKNIKFDNLKG